MTVTLRAMGNQLSSDEVKKVASLARLGLSDARAAAMAGQLSAVLGYVEKLRELDLEGVEPLVHVGDEVNRLAADEPGATLSNEDLMRMAPASDPPFVKVPKVLGEGGGA